MGTDLFVLCRSCKYQYKKEPKENQEWLNQELPVTSTELYFEVDEDSTE
jgi:hypothetical protein